MKKNSEIAKFGWKKIRIKWNLDLCNRNICVLLEHQSKGKKSIYLAATKSFNIVVCRLRQYIWCGVTVRMTVVCHASTILKMKPEILCIKSVGIQKHNRNVVKQHKEDE